MRSRFAAFANGDGDYLWRTLHPEHEDRAVPKDEWARSLRSATRTLRYMRLRVLDAKGSHVLFLASVFEKGHDRSFVERSTFAHDGTGWRYLSGETRDARGEDPSSWTVESFPRANAPA